MIDPLYNPNDPTGPRKSRFWALRHSARDKPQPWRWPLDALAGRSPMVLAQGITNRHGVEIGYESRPYDAQLFVPVFAAQDGEVMHCGETVSGFAISIDHKREGFATYYSHLSKVFVEQNLTRFNPRRQWVRGGDVIGYAAKSPIHLRFALWQWDAAGGFVAVDPIAKFSEWIAPLAKPEPAAIAEAA
jgi:murein DD-endopeptidase MepM/ murein hydrolase activator NlpD